MGVASIAIWNKNKFIVAIATSVWVTNIGFLIEGMSLSIHHASNLGYRDHLNVLLYQVSHG